MHYHLIGIKGSAMSGLAALLRAEGQTVSGSDLATTGHDPKNIPTKTNRIIYTPAVREGSPGWVELEAGRTQGIPTFRADELLGELTEGKTVVAITGAHGKSSTTAMVAHILTKAGQNPTVLLGAPVPEWSGKNYRVGRSDLWVLEADDYDRKFLTLHPLVAVVTNLDREHLDVYQNLSVIENAFRTFVSQIRPQGTLIASKDPSVDPILDAVDPFVAIVRYGEGTTYAPSTLPPLQVLGQHMRLNAAGALAAAVALGLDRKQAERALTTFRGTGRRLELVGERGGVIVYDDYGHHPTEIKATIMALREAFPNRRLVVAFQPHQHHRVRTLFDDFAAVFGSVDRLLLVDIYAVPGRDEQAKVSNQDLAEAIAEHGVNVSAVGDLGDLTQKLDSELQPGDVFLTMGATDITKIGRQWVASSKP